MLLDTIQDKDFLMKREQYRDLMLDARWARKACEAEDATARPSAWQTAVKVVAGAALAGLLLGFAASRPVAAASASAAAAAARPAMVMTSHSAEPITEPGAAPVAAKEAAYQQRMMAKERLLDPSAARNGSRLTATHSKPGLTSREKYLALKLRQVE